MTAFGDLTNNHHTVTDGCTATTPALPLPLPASGLGGGLGAAAAARAPGPAGRDWPCLRPCPCRWHARRVLAPRHHCGATLAVCTGARQLGQAQAGSGLSAGERAGQALGGGATHACPALSSAPPPSGAAAFKRRSRPGQQRPCVPLLLHSASCAHPAALPAGATRGGCRGSPGAAGSQLGQADRAVVGAAVAGCHGRSPPVRACAEPSRPLMSAGRRSADPDGQGPVRDGVGVAAA